MLIKRIHQFTEEQKKNLPIIITAEINCRDRKFLLEVIVSDEKLNEESTFLIYSTCAIYDDSVFPAKIMYHIVYTEQLTEEQCDVMVKEILANKEKFIFHEENK